MTSRAREEVRRFSETPIGELFRIVIGGFSPELRRVMMDDDIEDALQGVVIAVEAGAKPEDILRVREHVRMRLTRRRAEILRHGQRKKKR